MAEDNVSTYVLEISYLVENQLYDPFVSGGETSGLAEGNGNPVKLLLCLAHAHTVPMISSSRILNLYI